MKSQRLWVSFKSYEGVLLSLTPLQFNTSLQHKRATPFQTRNPSVQHKKFLSTGLLNRGVFGVELRSFWCGTEQFWCWTEGCVELRNFWCGTEGFLVWNWGVCWTEGFPVWNWLVFGVELRDFGVEVRDFGCWEGVVLVLNWCVEWRRSVLNWGVLHMKYKLKKLNK